MLENNLKVSLIILNWNGKKWLDDCLNSCINQSYKNLEIIFADNNSSDDSVEYVRKNWPSIKLVVLDENYGFALGNNKAVEYASGEFIVFLNNDIKLYPDFVEKLVMSIEPDTILIPKQLVGDFSKGEVDSKIFMGNGVDIFGYPYGVVDYSKQKVFYADGAALSIYKKDFLSLGGFDEKLFMFQEDIDLSWRARLIGIKIKTCPEAKLFHYSGGSAQGGSAYKAERYTVTSFRRYHNEKNVLRNILKNYSLLFAIPILLVLFVLHFFEALTLLCLNKTDLVRCYLNAYIWNIKNLGDTLSYRAKVQANRKVSDMTIIKNMYLSYSKITAIIRLGLPNFK